MLILREKSEIVTVQRPYGEIWAERGRSKPIWTHKYENGIRER